MSRLLFLLSVVLFSVYQTEQAYFLQENYINMINEGAKTWTAGVNFDPSTPKEYLIKLLGSTGVQSAKKASVDLFKTHDSAYDNLIGGIPKKFDARKAWRHCRTIGEVHDQGHCGSDWAISTTSAFADRLCVATNGDFNEPLSAEEITFCCHTCGVGCLGGGNPYKTWKHFSKHGVVTGGYEPGEGCQPYRVPPCNSTCKGTPKEDRHRCMKTCYGNEDLDFNTDHRFTRDFYFVSYGSIQKEVMTYGPIEASFEVYDDFFNYKSGVYVKSENATFVGEHAVKLIGWGEENGLPYWLMVNSWNEQWGDNGLFKIQRGTNECYVDNSTTAGIPVTN